MQRMDVVSSDDKLVQLAEVPGLTARHRHSRDYPDEN